MEEKLVYDPKSSLILDLVEEYINHYLYEEAETLLKDFLKENPITKRAIELWIEIAKAQGDMEKYNKLKEKYEKIKKVYVEEKIKLKEREFLKERKEIKSIDTITSFPLGEVEEPFNILFKGFGLGEIKKIIVEDSYLKLYLKYNSKWMEISFKENTKFPQVTWVMKSLEKIK